MKFISQENSVEDIRNYLEQTGVNAPVTFQELGFPNHRNDWVLRNLPKRTKLRAWLRSVLKEYPGLAD